MGFLETVASSFADMTLVIQIAGFIILFSASVYVKRKDLSKHFKLARIAASAAYLFITLPLLDFSCLLRPYFSF